MSEHEEKTEKFTFVCQDCKSTIAVNESFFQMTDDTFEKFSKLMKMDPQQREVLSDFKIQVGLLEQKIKKQENKSRKIDKKDQSLNEYEKQSKTIENHFEDFFEDLVRTTFSSQMPKMDFRNENEDDGDESSDDTGSSDDDEERLDKTKQTFSIQVFELISQKIRKNFPLCIQCTIIFFNEINELIKDELRQKKVYKTFLQHFHEKLNLDSDQFLLKNYGYELEIENILSEIDRLEEEDKKITKELKKIEVQENRSNQLEQKYLADLRNFQLVELVYEEDVESVLMKMEYAQKELDKLVQTSVINDVFHILSDGPFATINNFKLGKLQSIPVEWEEINAAWGLTTLLIVVLSRRFNYKFKNHVIIPIGSFSRIAKIQKTNEKENDPLKIKNYCELYFNNDGLLKRFRIKRFNQAMVWFLECVQEFAQFVNKSTKSFIFMYKIKKEKIHSCSIRYNSSNLAEWTRALKYLLTDLKQLMYWSTCKQAESVSSFSFSTGKKK
ncbi:beclin-1 [Anaeramoeba flamelloides]|uniref:Beclin-1 n=1 Tax=Anaeramoeba flamelloides TaxID=1746091 RepID=A0AAV8A1L8_9EUKA|nr:beclin-1 [Anaeramoeba flamelloides]